MDATQYKFFTPTRLIFGMGCAEEVGNRAIVLGGKRVLIVTDEGIVQAGLIDAIVKNIAKVGLSSTLYSEVQENPSVLNVHEGRDLILANEIDVLVALGGGSPMDAAKAMAVLSVHEGSIVEYELGLKPLKQKGPPLIAIPTTAGTGSEATMGAVITDPESHRKIDVVSPLMAPTVSLVDPLLTLSLPPNITAATGMDALTHAIEGYTATLASPLTDALHERSIRLLGKYLLSAFKSSGDKEARTNVMMASMITGVGFPNSGLGSVHGLSMPLGGHFGIPHGVANAILLPHVMQFNLRARESKFRDIARFLGGKGKDAQEAVDAVYKLRASLGIPKLNSFRMKDGSIPQLARDALGRNTNCVTNPREMKESDAEAVYRVALQEQ
jgi:alcohol dehydrogenase class IV